MVESTPRRTVGGVLKWIRFGGNTALKRRGCRRSCWRVVGCPCCRPCACALVSGLVGALPAWLCGMWPRRIRPRLGHPARRHTVLPSRACCLLLHSVHSFVVHSPRCKLCSVFLAKLTDMSKQQKRQRNQCPTFSVLKVDFLQILQFPGVKTCFCKRVWGSCH